MEGLPLVTGATGFAGSHLLTHLLDTEPRITAWSNPRGQPPRSRDARIAWRAVDLLDARAVAAALAAARPSAVYHCGGIADVAGSWSNPQHALQVNVLGTHHVLDGLSRTDFIGRALVTGSAQVYRQSDGAIREESAIGPVSPYGLSKLAQEMVALNSAAVPVILTRPFNHAGPGQSPAFATSSFARQIAEIEIGLREPVLAVGNLDARRDITDVRDVVRAYVLLMARGRPGRPYNICRGDAYRIGDLLEALLRLARTRVEIRVEPALVRPNDNPILLGDPARALSEAGWHAQIPIEQTLADLLDYWRGRLKPAP